MKRKYIIRVTVLILILVGVGLFLHQYTLFKDKDNYHGIPHYKEAQNFTLMGHSGNLVTLSQFKGKLVLISWGYTHCPDICPLTLSMLRDVMGELGNIQEKVQVLFITVDPQRDNVERLKDYVPYFHKSFLGLTGKPQEIEKVAKAYDVFFINHGDRYGRSEFDTWDGYLMSHTTTIYLVDQKGKLRLTYPYYKFDSKGIAEDIKMILR